MARFSWGDIRVRHPDFPRPFRGRRGVCLCWRSSRIFIVFRSFWTIGPTEVGLVRKRFGAALRDDGPVAFHGEAGYQAAL